MPRIARIVVPQVAHHVIQRGNRRQPVFFKPADYQRYLEILAEKLETVGTRVIGYCLMTNHVHLVVIPNNEEGLRPIGEAHRLYTRFINFREGWRGYLWQGRFSSYPLGERHLYEVIRYVELNPVRAGLVTDPDLYPHSSAMYRVSGKQHSLFHDLHQPNTMIADWPSYWREGMEKDFEKELIEKHEVTQKPLGNFTLPSGTQ